MDESERNKNVGKIVGGSANKNWAKAAGYGLIGSFLGLGKGDKFADRGRMKTAQEWENEIRAHELRSDINHHYGNARADRDLERANSHTDAAHEKAKANGRRVNTAEYNGKGGYKVSYGDEKEPAKNEKKPAAKSSPKKPATKPAAKNEKKPAAKPADKTPRAKAAPKKENPGMNYLNEEKYP